MAGVIDKARLVAYLTEQAERWRVKARERRREGFNSAADFDEGAVAAFREVAASVEAGIFDAPAATLVPSTPVPSYWVGEDQ